MKKLTKKIPWIFPFFSVVEFSGAIVVLFFALALISRSSGEYFIPSINVFKHSEHSILSSEYLTFAIICLIRTFEGILFSFFWIKLYRLAKLIINNDKLVKIYSKTKSLIKFFVIIYALEIASMFLGSNQINDMYIKLDNTDITTRNIFASIEPVSLIYPDIRGAGHILLLCIVLTAISIMKQKIDTDAEIGKLKEEAKLII